MVQQGAVPAASATSPAPRRQVSGGAVAGLAGAAVLLVFVIQNTQDVTLHFLVWSFTWPLWLFTILMAVVGALTWFGAGVVRRHRRRSGRRAERTT